MIDEEKKEISKNQLIAAAFVGWQSGGSEVKMSFQKYLEYFGLAEPEKLSDSQKGKIAARSLSKAAQIIAQDKRRNKE